MEKLDQRLLEDDPVEYAFTAAVSRSRGDDELSLLSSEESLEVELVSVLLVVDDVDVESPRICSIAESRPPPVELSLESEEPLPER